MRRRLELTELRSLERPSMYSIFHPLDPEERLPRELLLEGRRYKAVGRPELAGALWLPALWLVLAFTGSLEGNALVLLGMVAVLYTTFCAFAFLRKSR